MWLLSNTVPLVTLNSLRQARHFRVPGLVLAPLSSVTRSPEPQKGQTGPFGQRCASTNSRAVSSSWNLASLNTDTAVLPDGGEDIIPRWLVKYKNAYRFPREATPALAGFRQVERSRPPHGSA